MPYFNWIILYNTMSGLVQFGIMQSYYQLILLSKCLQGFLGRKFQICVSANMGYLKGAILDFFSKNNKNIEFDKTFIFPENCIYIPGKIYVVFLFLSGCMFIDLSVYF